jgi:hypothetical protein
MKQYLAAVLIGITACQAPRTLESGALLRVPEEYRFQLSEAIERLEPLVIEILGTEWPWRYEVSVESGMESRGETTRWFSRSMKIRESSFLNKDDLDFVITHELVHIHVMGEWEELPLIIEDGVANWIAGTIVGLCGPTWKGSLPTPIGLRQALTLEYDEYQALDPDLKRFVDHAAMYIGSGMVEFPGVPKRKPPVLRDWNPPASKLKDEAE